MPCQPAFLVAALLTFQSVTTPAAHPPETPVGCLLKHMCRSQGLSCLSWSPPPLMSAYNMLHADLRVTYFRIACSDLHPHRTSSNAAHPEAIAVAISATVPLAARVSTCPSSGNPIGRCRELLDSPQILSNDRGVARCCPFAKPQTLGRHPRFDAQELLNIFVRFIIFSIS